MKKIRTICMICGKSHDGKKRPKRCAYYGKLLSACCKKVEVWKVMRVSEVYGLAGVETLARELGVKV